MQSEPPIYFDVHQKIGDEWVKVDTISQHEIRGYNEHNIPTVFRKCSPIEADPRQIEFAWQYVNQVRGLATYLVSREAMN